MHKPKYMLNITLSIALIIIAILTATIHLVAVIMNMSINAYNSILPCVASAIMSGANFILAAIAVIMCGKTTKRESIDIYIILAVLLLSVSIMPIIMNLVELGSVYFYVEFLIYAGLLTLSLIALFKKDAPPKVKAGKAVNTEQAEEPQTPDAMTLSDKVSQIKRMRELCLVSDEQVQEAINRLIDAELKKS